MKSPVFCVKNGRFICFFRELLPLSVCFQSIIRVSDNTLTWTYCISVKPQSLSVCICHLCLSANGWDMFSIWHMPHPDLLSLFFLSSLQPSKPSWREGVLGVRCDLSAPEGGFAKQKVHLGFWMGGNQALLSNSMSEMFLALLHSRG